MTGRRAVGAVAALGAASAVAVAAEGAARRLEGGLRPPLPTDSEAASKLDRLRTLALQGRSPQVLFVGASVLDADISPTVVDSVLGRPGATFNACLTGSDLETMRRWWRVVAPEVRPEVVVVEAHPGMMLPPGTMADKLHAHLDRLVAHLDAERPPRRPALAALASAGWPAVRSSARLAWGRAPDAGAAGSSPRNRPDGHLTVFQDVPFEVGSRQLGDDDWYELVEIDLSAPWRHDDYLAFVDEVRGQVPAVAVAVSPLLLEGAPATATGSHIPAAISDATVARARARPLPVVDLRAEVGGAEDFADPFHLRAHAVERVSRAAGHAVARLLGAR